ncbi:MAG: hypothetical protein HOV80_23975 [Polyangiaceae bacterium]|nr:hypothetical protein [Polyangiaceae bacterium]
MLLSRFWYLILSAALAAAVGVLFIAQSYYNRNTERWMNEALAADASAVGWYLKDDARNRAAALLPVALAPKLREALAKANESDEVPKDTRAKAKEALLKALEGVPPEQKFYAVWAVDQDGRVIASYGYEHKDDWNLGGHAVVADALAGWIRDDTWIFKKEELHRVVARPVERDGGGEPIGAIVGIFALDRGYAQAVSERTGAAVAFYALGTQVWSHGPEGFNSSNFEVLRTDLKETEQTEEYQQKGRSKVRQPRADLGFIYTRIPGEAWDLQSGYVVGRQVRFVETPQAFIDAADQTDKDHAPTWILVGIAFGLGLLGILFSVFEHTMPLRTFKSEAAKFAVAKTDTLAPSKFRGLYKKIAADINDGVDKVLSKGGITRRAADLEQVIGPLPAQPQMSAFAVPGEGAAPPAAPAPQPSTSGSSGSFPRVPGTEKRVPGPPPKPSRPGMPAPPPRPPGAAEAEEEAAISAPSGPVSAPSRPTDELAEWKLVYEEFLKTKKQCGEPTESLTFDKFKGTLERNKAALVARHNCSFVKFTVYVKDGKAALRASPVK